ncbi:hypothetical protein [Vibrio parahaemolyticus]|uniref:hypothetical protein n=1 Tax=Vibrio parahaemolyticus TaxID=670 RepID=UPI001E3CC552|nr:hypothetical protein [Vibrio parahaemolyticus]MCD2151992.1 hypothetical protein [Vibrio parahaemolyticus]HCJ4668947.1 hypothetical protein [Vibrio parahaemolyticus]
MAILERSESAKRCESLLNALLAYFYKLLSPLKTSFLEKSNKSKLYSKTMITVEFNLYIPYNMRQKLTYKNGTTVTDIVSRVMRQEEDAPKLEDLIRVRAQLEGFEGKGISVDVYVKSGTEKYDGGDIIDGVIVSGGISAYRDYNDINVRMLPKAYGGRARDSRKVWSITLTKLADNNLTVVDNGKPTHVLIRPSEGYEGITLQQYQERVAKTLDSWTLEPAKPE